MSDQSESDAPLLTWRELWHETTAVLNDAHHARWICESASGMSGLEWYDGLDEPVGERGVARVDAMVARRRAGEPLQYVLGSWAFRHLELMVDRRVLIPRPETEELVTVALEVASQLPRPLCLADLGTGSGAIAMALASELPLDGTTVWATDVSPDALDVARANLAGVGRAGRNITLALGSWFDALPAELRGALDLIVSNPPYIADASPEVTPDVYDWEPHVALFAGDGLVAYRTIVAEAPPWLRPGGWLVLEIGFDQAAAVTALCTTAGLIDVECRRDAAGNDRIVLARRPEFGA